MKPTAVDDTSKSLIRRKVHEFFRNNVLPTVSKIEAAIRDDPDLPTLGRTTVYKVLKNLQFKFVKRQNKSILMERDDLVTWRRKYLRQIRHHCSMGRTIYYTDETWINAGQTVTKVWSDCTVTSTRQAHLKGLSTGVKNPCGKGSRLIIVHIGSSKGFVANGWYVFESKKSGDYHEEMNGTVYEDWLKDVLPDLEPNSVIVLDNASYHSQKINKIYTYTAQLCSHTTGYQYKLLC
ncbi:hypothetical protein V9T40_013552 [Parthenolecanium corni]|uniref:Tc1-like transposase DDE domain-containing protein n=1 Tax=Parthenolecanium corni TaxID=536013 RepID=A0AAN9TD02_9HEMI